MKRTENAMSFFLSSFVLFRVQYISTDARNSYKTLEKGTHGFLNVICLCLVSVSMYVLRGK